MADRACPNCGKTVPDWNYCAECGAPLADAKGAELSGSDLPPSEPPAMADVEPPEADESAAPPPPPEDEGGLTAETLEPRGPHQEPIVAGATPVQQAAAATRAAAPPIDGQLRCPNCGEAVYEGERVCWGCSRRLEAAPEAAQHPEVPIREPESGAPVPTTAAAPPASVAAQPQQRISRQAPDEAVSYAWWSFALGLLSVFTCGVLGLLGLPALWLGVSAARRQAGPVAIAGAVFGALGLLIFLAWIVVFVVAMPGLLRSSPMHIMIPTSL